MLNNVMKPDKDNANQQPERESKSGNSVETINSVGLIVQGFSPDADYSKIDVIRYLPLDRFLSLLELEAMWFSRLGALQDKFECTNPEGARAFVLKLAEDPEAVKRCKSAWPMGWELMMGVTEHGQTGDDGRKMFAVNCWFMGELESAKMWREYGDGGKGVAIRSTVKRLTTTFQITGDYKLVSRIGRIDYVDFKSPRLGVHGNDVMNVAFIKDKAYETESEVRILTPNYLHAGCIYPDGSQAGLSGSATFSPHIKGFYIKCDLKELIRGVIVGPNSHPYFRMLMKRVVARYGLAVDVEYSQLAHLT